MILAIVSWQTFPVEKLVILRGRMLKKMPGTSLVSSSAVYLTSNVLAAALPFALLPVHARYLTPSEYGQVAMFQTLLAGLSALAGFSVQGAAGQKYFAHSCLPGTLRSGAIPCRGSIFDSPFNLSGT